MIKRILLLVFILASIQSANAQSHLDFHYVVDATVYSDGEQLTFVIYEYPVFTSHASDTSQQKLEELIDPNLALQFKPRSEELDVVSELLGMEPNEILSGEMLFNMMKNRIGMMGMKMKDTNYVSHITIDRVTFPDHRVSDFNFIRTYQHVGTSVVGRIDDIDMQAMSWATGEVYHIGDFGSKKALECIEKAIAKTKHSSLSCGDSTLQQFWVKGLGCETVINAKSESEWTFLVDSRAFDCEPLKQPFVEVDIDPACFEKDKPCSLKEDPKK